MKNDHYGQSSQAVRTCALPVQVTHPESRPNAQTLQRICVKLIKPKEKPFERPLNPYALSFLCFRRAKSASWPSSQTAENRIPISRRVWASRISSPSGATLKSSRRRTKGIRTKLRRYTKIRTNARRCHTHRCSPTSPNSSRWRPPSFIWSIATAAPGKSTSRTSKRERQPSYRPPSSAINASKRARNRRRMRVRRRTATTNCSRWRIQRYG